jgi:hypothetical protein
LWINGVDEIIGSTPVGSGAPKHIAWVRYNGVHKVYLAGVSQGSYTSSSTITPYAVAFGAVVEDDSSFFDQAYGLIDELRWRDAAEYTSDFTPPSAEFEEGDSWEGYAAAATPLGAPVAQGGTLYGFVAVPSIFGSVALTGSSTNGFVSVGSPLSGELVLGRHDFSAAVANWQITYEMDLITPDGPVTVPISSWQATLQTDAQSYLGCVIPACTAWLDTLEVATDFRIRRVARQGTQVAESEMASASLDTSQLDQGPTNYTASINGYSAAFDVVEEPEAVYDRVLTGIRSISSYSSGATRVRCEIDWLLRPSQRAWIDDNTSFVVSYINYYVPTGGDAYMDVGARP